jgi:hypothetical protein
MRSNIGTADKAVRITLAVVLTVLYFNGTVQGIVGIIALVLAGIFLLTSLVGFCPLYAIFGLSTKSKSAKLG